MTFKALLLDEAEGKVSSRIADLDEAQLPEGDVLVRVAYSDLNYKDGMILNGLGKLVRTYPHVPGIDFVGTVEESSSPDYKPGDAVILTGWRVGEVHWGGFAQKARVKAEWLVPLPKDLSPKRAMALGTAGLTAMLAVMALEEHGLTPQSEGEVLVTGAAGGVGSVAVALLSDLGYRVAAATGRAETHAYLQDLGAASIVDRIEVATPPKGPMGAQRWSGCIDNVGGAGLGAILASLYYWGSVASVGNAGGIKFETTVLPFLLRGVNLLGIDSATCPKARRIKAWDRLARQLSPEKLDRITHEAALSELPGLAGTILKGQIQGRTVIDVNR